MEKRLYFPALDGLRALAVTAVFVRHYLVNLVPPSLAYGWTGVDIFFVLSGFLITGILYDSRTLEHRWRDFYIRRTLRIFPLYYGIIFCVLLTTPYLHWRWSLPWLSFPAYVFNLMPTQIPGHSDRVLGHLVGLLRGKTFVTLYFDHFWTLCVEEQFYLLWPAVIFAVQDRKKLLRIMIVLIVCVLIFRIGMMMTAFGHAHPERIVRATYARMDSLLLGGVVALLLRGPAAERVMRWGGRLLAVGSALFLATALIAVYALHQSSSADEVTPWIASVGFTIVGIMACGLLLLCLRQGSWLNRVFQASPLRWIGQRSYGIYIFHMIPIQPALVLANKAASRIHPAPAYLTPVTVLLQTIFALIVTLIAATLSYRFFEQPFLRLKDRWTRQAPQAATRTILRNDVAAT